MSGNLSYAPRMKMNKETKPNQIKQTPTLTEILKKEI